MGVHDKPDSKFGLIKKRSASNNVFPENPSKILKNEDTNKQNNCTTKNGNNDNHLDKNALSLQQQRKALPVYKLRKK